MKHAVCILILFAALSSTASGQEQKSVQRQDSSANQSRILDPGISLGRPTLLLPLSLGTTLEEFPAFFRHTPGVRSPFISGVVQEKIDLMSSFELQRARQEELRTLRSILSTVQVGGVAYIVYRHIKKYGLK